MHQKSCATCSKELELHYISCDLIQCYDCFEKWKISNQNNPVVRYINPIYESLHKKYGKKTKPQNIDFGDMVV